MTKGWKEDGKKKNGEFVVNSEFVQISKFCRGINLAWSEWWRLRRKTLAILVSLFSQPTICHVAWKLWDVIIQLFARLFSLNIG